jgi:filamentous hemagglutinin family protein
VCPTLSPAQVTTSPPGTPTGLSTKVTPTVTATGTTYSITGGTRPGSGPNLFHSFVGFSLAGAGDVANFCNAAACGATSLFTGIDNIVGRVTGNETSSIFGTIRTTGFGSASLFLVNPAGWIFGPTARLDVGGSFHVSTADYVRFSDGAIFHADVARETVLTSAPPAAFGFLGPPAGGITVDGSTLQVGTKQRLTLVGGDIRIGVINPDDGSSSGGSLIAPGGRLDLASVASKGEVTLGSAAAPELGVASFPGGLGAITLNPGALLDVSGAPAGSIVIRGGRLVATGSALFANTLALPPGTTPGTIDIAVTNDVTLDQTFVDVSGQPAGSIVIRGGSLLANGAALFADASGDANSLTPGIDISVKNKATFAGGTSLSAQISGAGDGGDISIEAGSVEMREGAFGNVVTTGTGRGGAISIKAANVTLTEGGTLASLTFGGPAGDISVTADSLLISSPFSSISSSTTSALTNPAGEPVGTGGSIKISAGSVKLTDGAGITSASSGVAAGGDIVIQGKNAVSAGAVTLTGGAQIASQAGDAQGGDILINAGSVTMSGSGTRLLSGGSGASLSFAPVGDISLTVGQLTLTSNAVIQNGNALDRAGNITIQANGPVEVSSGAKILSQAFSEKVGDVTISAPSLTVDAGLVQTSTVGSGDAGNINLSAGELRIANGGAISAQSSGTADVTGGLQPGKAGNINIVIGDTLRMENGSITTAAAEAAGGNITITHTGSLLHLTDSKITTSVNGGDGRGGNITIGAELDPTDLTIRNANPFEFVVLNNSQIRADAFRGAGGNITILTDGFLTQNSVLSASSALSTPGTISVQAQTTNVTGALTQLPANVLQAATLLRASCAARLAQGKTSTLVVAGREGVPPEPEGLLWSPLAEGPATRGLSWSDGHGWETFPRFARVSLLSKCER